MLSHDIAEGAENVAQATSLRIAFGTIVHDVDGVCDAFVSYLNLVQTSEVTGEDDERSCEEEVNDSWVAPR